MSIQFENPMNEETAERIKKTFGDKIAVIDERNVLLERLSEINQKEMKAIANTAGQPVTVNIHDQGDIIEMSDGTKYCVTTKGRMKV